MKTHLPKAFFAALLAAITVSTTLAKDYDVGTFSGGGNTSTSAAGNYWTPTDGTDLTLSGTGAEADWLGAKDAAGNKITGYGTQSWEYKGGFLGIGGKWEDSTKGTVTNNAKLGTLIVEDEAKVQLGGQYKTSTDIANIGSIAEFTGIIADQVIVKDKASVNTWNGTIGTLEVSDNATVNLHTGRGEGNSYFCYDGAYDSKQVQIKQALNVKGGTVNIGNASYIDSTNSKDAKQNPDTDYHTVTTFGSINFVNPKYNILGSLTGADDANISASLISQSGGVLNVSGKSASVGGLNIKQEGGTMNISTSGSSNDTWHFLADYGDSKITQSGDSNTVLNIGGIKAYNSKYDSVLSLLQDKGVTHDPNKGELSTDGKKVEINPSVVIEQTGAGTININKGIILTNQKTGADSTEASSITQSGGGKIYLKGNYEGAVFNIEQKDLGGQIELHGSMSSDTVTQSSSAAKLNIKSTATLNAAKMETAGTVTNSGSMQVEQLEINSGSVTNEKNAVIAADSIIINGGVFTNNGTINKTQSQQMLMTLAADEPVGTTAIVINAGEYQNFGTTTQDIVVNGGILTLGANSDVAGVTMNSGIINVDGAATADALTLNGGQINFATGATIDMGGADIALGSKVIITLNIESLDELPDSVTLFEGLGAGSTGTQQFEVRFVDANNQSQSGKINYAEGKITATIPEPASTTLSFLALAALAARRRRALAAA